MRTFNKNYARSQEELINFCEENISTIVEKQLENLPLITIRYIDPIEEKFGYAKTGNFLFFENKLYLLVNKYSDESSYFKPLADRDVLLKIREKTDTITNRDFFAVRVLFAGVFTGFLDELGKPIFTGDIVDFREGFGGIAVFPINDKYSLLADNHAFALYFAEKENRKLYVNGSLFYKLAPTAESLDIRDLWNGMFGVSDYDTEFIKRTPNFRPSRKN